MFPQLHCQEFEAQRGWVVGSRLHSYQKWTKSVRDQVCVPTWGNAQLGEGAHAQTSQPWLGCQEGLDRTSERGHACALL